MADDTIKQKVLVEYEAKVDSANSIASVLAGALSAKLDAVADKFNKQLAAGGRFLNEHITRVPGFEGIAGDYFGYKKGEYGQELRTPSEAMASWFAAGGQTSHFQTSIYNRAALASSVVVEEGKDGMPLISHRLDQDWKDKTEAVFRKLDAARKGIANVEAVRAASDKVQSYLGGISASNPHYVNSAYATLAANAMRSIARNKRLDLSAEESGSLYSAATGLITAFGRSKDPIGILKGLSVSDNYQEESNWRIQNAVENIMSGMDPEARAWFSDEFRRQDAVGKTRQVAAKEESNWRIQNAMWNLTEGRKMDPEAKRYFQELYGKNTEAVTDMTSAFRKFVLSGALAGAAIKAIDTYYTTRASILSDTKTPYSTAISSIGGVAKGTGLGMVGLGALLAPFTGGWSLLLSAAGVGTFGAGAKFSSDEKIRQANWLRGKDIMRNLALYGSSVDYNYAQAVDQTGYASAGDMLNLNATSAMLPGAMAFGAVGENELMALSYMPNYWEGLMRGASTSELAELFRSDLMAVRPEFRPYLSSIVPGGSEALRAYTFSDSYHRFYNRRNEFSGYDNQQYYVAAALSRTKDERILKDIAAENVDFTEDIPAMGRGTITPTDENFDRAEKIEDTARAIQRAMEMSKNQNGESGNIIIYLNGDEAANVPIKAENYISYAM